MPILTTQAGLSELPLPLLAPKTFEDHRHWHLTYSQAQLNLAAGPHAWPSRNPALSPPAAQIEKELLLLPDSQKLTRGKKLQRICPGVYYPSQLAVTPLVRALALAQLLPPGYRQRLHYSRLTAAWIHGYHSGPLPQKLDVNFAPGDRVHLPKSIRELYCLHADPLPSGQTQQLGYSLLTSPLATALELILTQPREGQAISTALKIMSDPASGYQPQTFQGLFAQLKGTGHIHWEQLKILTLLADNYHQENQAPEPRAKNQPSFGPEEDETPSDGRPYKSREHSESG